VKERDFWEGVRLIAETSIKGKLKIKDRTAVGAYAVARTPTRYVARTVRLKILSWRLRLALERRLAGGE
jgi:hypothetical protein